MSPLELAHADPLVSVAEKLPAIQAMASELFGDVVGTEVIDDPEIPGFRYLSIAVRVQRDRRTVANLQTEWRRRLDEFLGEHSQAVHLAIDIDE